MAEIQGLLFDALQVEGPEDIERAVVDRDVDLEAELRGRFGHSGFRPGQEEAVEAVLAGRDALVVMPTGGGKSLTYTLPAFLLPGTTIVVSPLISLMSDQAARLSRVGPPGSVRALNSQVGRSEQDRILADLTAGRIKILLLAPERFRNTRFRRALRCAQVSLLAVDEAHCVSRWGHDFRPDYLTLGEEALACGRPPILAVTATATREVRLDIARQLGLRDDAQTLVCGFDRPNLFLSTALVEGGTRPKLAALRAYMRQVPGFPGIVYCATRRSCDRVGRELSRSGARRVGVYHAGLPTRRRQQVQEAFFAGDLDVVVATNAFGLGIDKQDLRFVLHHDLPGSLEAYYQEAGRAGRDGQPANCALLFGYEDLHLQRWLISTSHPDRALVEEVAQAGRLVGWNPVSVRRRMAVSTKSRSVDAALRLLERAGRDPAAVDYGALQARSEHELELLDRMLAYARGGRCRRRAVLEYFDAPDPPPSCEACDQCRPDRAPSLNKTKNTRTRSRRATSVETPRRKKRKTAAPADASLLSRLRGLRGRIAKRRRVPAYKVFHDKTLLELAAKRPATRQELLDIHGLGKRKVARYGDQLLELLALEL